MIAQPSLITAVTMVTFAMGAPSALAADKSAETRSVTVHYRDLDLTRESGIAALKARIAHAADVVCGPVEIRDLQDLHSFDACRSAAVAAADADAQAAVASARRSLYASSRTMPGTN